MTCIVAHKDGWMVADQRVLWGHMRGPFKEAKVHNFAGTLVGIAGDARASHLVREALEGAPVSADRIRVIGNALRNECEKESIALVVHEGKVYEMGRAGSAHEVLQDYWSIGSGFQVALGYIKGSGAPVTVELAQSAIEYASQLCADVGDGTRVVYAK